MHRENRHALAAERARAEGGGYRFWEERRGGCTLGILEVERGEENLAAGRHLSLRFPSLLSLSPSEEWEVCLSLSELLCEECQRLLGSLFSSSTRVLFAGLGNPHATADALGPLSVGHIHPTAHLSEEVRKKSACAALSVFAPLVPALSGMQSGTLLHGARAASGATLVLLLDAVVTESPERLGRVIQLTDTGILPGGGIGEGGVKLDRDYLGVPVLAIGVPTVLDATARIRDESGRPIEGFDYLLPREADALVDRFSRMIARAVEGAFGLPHPL